MSQENVEVVKAVFQAWASRDPGAALRLIDPAVELDATGVSFPGEGMVATGHEGLQSVVESWTAAWRSLEFAPQAFIESGDHVIVWLHVTAEGRASGVPTEMEMAVVYTLRGGLVVGFRYFESLAAAAEFVGI